jgi:pimeloyl-ACP methyl ester carboxylesterase
MDRKTRLSVHLIVVILFCITAAARIPALAAHDVDVAQTAPPSSEAAVFNISYRGTPVGQETVVVTRTESGWTVSSSGGQTAPSPFTIDKFEAVYSRAWQPVSVEIEARSGDQSLSLKSLFTATSATTDVMQGGQKNQVTQQISPGTVVLPNNFFGAYEALAARLSALQAGASFPVYVLPQAEVVGTITAVTPQRIQTTDRLIELRHYSVAIRNPAGLVNVEIGIDEQNRLARLAVPSAGILVLRNDLSGVMKRDVTYTNTRDQQVFINSLGFTIAATITPPPTPGARMPAVVLIAGAGSADRDETVANVPVFGQLSGDLSKAGFFVVRYDKRGLGQSGGRAESAALGDYADDAVKVVEWLSKRKDIDPKRISLVGYSEGGYIAMLAASRAGDKIAAIALVASPGTTGREFVMAQQQHALALSDDSEDVKAAKIQLQQRILTAVTTGGWSGVPPQMQRQADTLWFKSLVEFDPAAVMKKLKQPVLIVHGAQDMVIAASNAGQLEALAVSRKEKSAAQTKKIVLPGLNHLLVPATTGEVSEYVSLPVRTISPEVAKSIADWLGAVLIAAQ